MSQTSVVVFFQQADVILKLKDEEGGPNVDLRQQPFANPNALQQTISSAYRDLKTRRPAVLKAMSLYLANKDTEYILFKPIKASVLILG